MMLLNLFWTFFQVGILSFGGGYAALPIICEKVTSENTWLTVAQFTDVVTISQMTPGPIGINAATFVGMRLYGVLGAMCATLGFVSPACIIVTILAIIYKKYRKSDVMGGVLTGLRPASVGLIASAALSIITTAFFGAELFEINIKNTDIIAVCVSIAAYILMKKVKKLSSPISIIILSGIVGGSLYLIFGGV